MIPTPYLYQTSQWERFWLQSHDNNHRCYELHVVSNNFTIRGNVFMYPWHFGQKIFHIPAGPYIEHGNPSPTHLYKSVIEFMSKVADIGRQQQVLCTKWDMDPNVAMHLGITSQIGVIELIKEYTQSRQLGIPVPGNHRMMYPNIAVIPVHNMTIPQQRSSNVDIALLKDFFDLNQTYWLTVSETTRKQTRKSLKYDWILDTQKSQTNIHAAYTILQHTASRQRFSLPTLEYFLVLAQQDFCEFVSLKDGDGKMQAVWFGLHYGDVLTNLYGGNMQDSLKKLGPNLMQLYGLFTAVRLGCTWYDMGGYEQNKSSTFKDGYRPQLITFPGNVDIVYLPWYYRILEFGAKGKRLLKR